LSLRSSAQRVWNDALKPGAALTRGIKASLSPYLPATICVDVGASYFPHGKWFAFLHAPAVSWLAVEPNSQNLGYVDAWSFPSRVSTCTTGLSRDGGPQTLYVTNVDSGSSLLPPQIPASQQHRFSNSSYFFPVREVPIETLTLEQAIADFPPDAPVVVKLDTQGTELSILQGAQRLFDEHRIIGIEMESTLLAQPFMQGSGKFWQACEFLEAQGFELTRLDPILFGRRGRAARRSPTVPNECDAVFTLRRDVTAELPVESRAAVLGWYATYRFCDEALALLREDQPLVDFLRDRGCKTERLIATLSRAAG